MYRASSSSTQSPPATHASRLLKAIPSLPCSQHQHRMLRVSTGHTHKLVLTFFSPSKKRREAGASSTTVGKSCKELLELALTTQRSKLFPDPCPQCLLEIRLIYPKVGD